MNWTPELTERLNENVDSIYKLIADLENETPEPILAWIHPILSSMDFFLSIRHLPDDGLIGDSLRVVFRTLAGFHGSIADHDTWKYTLTDAQSQMLDELEEESVDLVKTFSDIEFFVRDYEEVKTDTGLFHEQLKDLPDDAVISLQYPSGVTFSFIQASVLKSMSQTSQVEIPRG